ECTEAKLLPSGVKATARAWPSSPTFRILACCRLEQPNCILFAIGIRPSLGIRRQSERGCNVVFLAQFTIQLVTGLGIDEDDHVLVFGSQPAGQGQALAVRRE